MVCDFVIYISYGCSSHMDDFHFIFSKIHGLRLCPFLPLKWKADLSTLTRESGKRWGEGGEGRGEREGKRKGFTLLQSCRGSIQLHEKSRANEFYSVVANHVQFNA